MNILNTVSNLLINNALGAIVAAEARSRSLRPRQAGDAAQRSPLHNPKAIMSPRTRAIKALMVTENLTRALAESKYDKDNNRLVRERFARKSKGM